MSLVGRRLVPQQICNRIYRIFYMLHFYQSYETLRSRQQPILNIIKNRIMLHNSQVLRLGLELLISVLTRSAHHWIRHLLRAHLLSHLTSGCFWSVGDGCERREGGERTVVAAEKEDVDELQTKDAEEVPADTGHPAGIHVLCLNTSLEHALELDSDREW